MINVWLWWMKEAGRKSVVGMLEGVQVGQSSSWMMEGKDAGSVCECRIGRLVADMSTVRRVLVRAGWTERKSIAWNISSINKPRDGSERRVSRTVSSARLSGRIVHSQLIDSGSVICSLETMICFNDFKHPKSSWRSARLTFNAGFSLRSNSRKFNAAQKVSLDKWVRWLFDNCNLTSEVLPIKTNGLISSIPFSW